MTIIDSEIETNISTFKDMKLKPEIIRALGDAGFETPSEVQSKCIPKAILGKDIICQAKSGMGKTIIFVLSVLNNIKSLCIDSLILTFSRELTHQLSLEFYRFSKYLENINIVTIYGGIPESVYIDNVSIKASTIIIGTPGKVLSLLNKSILNLSCINKFILDECDILLSNINMRNAVQTIFHNTNKNKQVMMFSATIDKESLNICTKFVNDPIKVLIDKEKNLVLHGLRQYYFKTYESEKLDILCFILKNMKYNQLIIFLKSVRRAHELNMILNNIGYKSVVLCGGLKQEDRISLYKKIKRNEFQILITTELLSRGIDIERINVVINYDLPNNSNTYLHRIGRAGRFGTSGKAVTFVSTFSDIAIINDITSRFGISLEEMKIDDIEINK